MKRTNILIMALLAVLSLVSTGCEDDKVSDGEFKSDRLFMPMFRQESTTNNKDDRYKCAIASEAPDAPSNFVNDIMLYWYGVDGAEGYHIKGIVQGTDWDLNAVLDTIVGPEVLELLHTDLQYATGYRYSIRALSPKGEAYHSKWYGRGDGSHQDDYTKDSKGGAITTGERYVVPSLFWTEDVTKESLVVHFNLEAESGYETKYPEFIEAGAEVVDGKWVLHEIQVVPTSDNPNLPTLIHNVTEDDLNNGYVEFSGLSSNGAYIVYGQNNNLVRKFDRQYNKTMLRMKGDLNEPILIEAKPDPNDTILVQYHVAGLEVTRIDTVLTNYMGDNSIAEGQIFYLEGGKTYYIASTVEMVKGFTLETNPEDIAAKKGRATVYLGVGTTAATGLEGVNRNFNLARNAKSGSENGMVLTIQDIRFKEINFRPHTYFNFLDTQATYVGGNASRVRGGNYFMNMSSQGLSFWLSELSVINCSFSGCTRGFIRFQGPNRQTIEKLIVDGCVFYDNGPYDDTGRGYSWFAGPGSNPNSNFFKNLTFSNNTIIDSPRHALVSEAKQLAWPTGTRWNIVIDNNTFVNFSPRSASSGHGLLLEIRYAPGESFVAVRRNLFVSTRYNDEDTRSLYWRGMRVETPNVNYDIADNYATTVPTWRPEPLIDGLWTNYAFRDTKNGAGHTDGLFNKGGFEETIIKFGDNVNGNEPDAIGYQLSATQLFKNPIPLAPMGDVDMHKYNYDGFYYNTTPDVMNHPIYTKNIGDQRWKNGGNWK